MVCEVVLASQDTNAALDKDCFFISLQFLLSWGVVEHLIRITLEVPNVIEIMFKTLWTFVTGIKWHRIESFNFLKVFSVVLQLHTEAIQVIQLMRYLDVFLPR